MHTKLQLHMHIFICLHLVTYPLACKRICARVCVHMYAFHKYLDYLSPTQCRNYHVCLARCMTLHCVAYNIQSILPSSRRLYSTQHIVFASHGAYYPLSMTNAFLHAVNNFNSLPTPSCIHSIPYHHYAALF